MSKPKGVAYSHIVCCPRCDRKYGGKDKNEVWNRVKKHVAEQHPDHDPEWFDTYPEHE